jgi:alpha-methylacyl-CoA racemase
MPQFDRSRWPEFKQRLTEVFARRTAREWGKLLEGEEACATVVRGVWDAPEHPHMAARGTFVDVGGARQPGPAPRFSRTAPAARPAHDDPDAALKRWGLDRLAREQLRAAGVLL